MAELSAADRNIAALTRRLQELKGTRGTAYWQDPEVRTLQDRLRGEIGAYAAWGEDKLPMHQQARRAARYEAECAPLLWPGSDGE